MSEPDRGAARGEHRPGEPGRLQAPERPTQPGRRLLDNLRRRPPQQVPAFGSDHPGPSPERAVVIDGVSRSFTGPSGTIVALEKTSIVTKSGEFVTFLGPSGCGKSTLFNIVAGLLPASTGSVCIDGRDVTGLTGHVSYMLQRDLLLPWRKVIDNVIVGLEAIGRPKNAARAQARELLDRFGLSQFADVYPQQMSGGMRQRAAFIRTMLFPRDVLLLDEPLGALDAQTRLIMQEWLLQIWTEERKTVLFITHDIDEAVFLSDRVYVMSARPGRIINDVRVDLPRPRTADIRTSEEYFEIRSTLLRDIHGESVKAFNEGVR
ncbi:MAG: transporter [Acidimicrobiaceae bacterium]|nr:transporter [Acidimicrobiaceae bacterium]